MIGLTRVGLKGNPSACETPKKLEDSDWADLYEISGKQGLTPLVHAGILACHLTPPGDIAASFVKYIRAAQLRADQAYDQLREIAGAFEAQKIDLIALKGVPFAFRYYPSPGLRRFGDIDILVQESQLDLAGDTLLRLGYKSLDSAEAAHPSQFLDHDLKYHCGYERGEQYPVELHWRLTPRNSPVRFDMAGLWGRSYLPERAGDLGRALAFEDEAVFLASHMARHEFLMPARAFVDLALLLSSTPGYDIEKLWQRAADCKALADLAAALGVTAELGLVTLPSDLAHRVAKQAATDRVNLPALARYVLSWPQFEYADRAVDLLTAPGPKATIKRLREIAFPRYDSLVEREEKAGEGETTSSQPSVTYGGLWKARLLHWGRKMGNLRAETANLLVSVRLRKLFQTRTVRQKD
jgi:hypothetical protein